MAVIAVTCPVKLLQAAPATIEYVNSVYRRDRTVTEEKAKKDFSKAYRSESPFPTSKRHSSVPLPRHLDIGGCCSAFQPPGSRKAE